MRPAILKNAATNEVVWISRLPTMLTRKAKASRPTPSTGTSTLSGPMSKGWSA